MKTMRPHDLPVGMAGLCCSLLIATAVHAAAPHAAQPARHFNLTNATYNSVTSLAIAPSESNQFHDVMLGEPLQGGLTSIDVDVPDGGCMRDVLVTFRNQHTLLYPHLDMCRYDGLRLNPRDDDQSVEHAVARVDR
jgi:hypothetical protein